MKRGGGEARAVRYRSQAAIGEKGGEIEGEGGKMQGDHETSETYGKGEELQRAVLQEQQKVGAATSSSGGKQVCRAMRSK